MSMETVSFATASRSGFAENLPVIRDTLKRTKSYAATSRMTGVPEITLRALLAPPTPRKSYVRPSPPVPAVSASPLTIREIIMLCCAEEGVTYQDMMGDVRTREMAWPRMRMMWLVKQAKPNASLPEIGRRFGGRDHTTVIHAIRTVPERILVDAEERQKLTALIEALSEVASPRDAAAAIDGEIATLEARLEVLRDKRVALNGACMKFAA